jgi:phosphate transport system substrate-binding protein
MNIRSRAISSCHALLLLAVLALNAMNPPLAAAEERLDITGASTIAPLVAEIAKRFEEEHSDVRIDVQTGGSSRGIADARQGIADIGMVSRALKDDEKDLIAFPIARDGVALILHASNPVSALSRDQIIGIYKRDITNWSEVGGLDRPITVVNKAEGRSTLEIFLAQLGLEITDVRPHVIIGDNEQGVKVVAGNPDAIGYVSIGSAEFHVQNGTPLKLLTLGSIAPTTENVANGTYEASRPLNLVTNKPPTGLSKAFLDYACSAAVDDLIREQYFVPIKH